MRRKSIQNLVMLSFRILSSSQICCSIWGDMSGSKASKPLINVRTSCHQFVIISTTYKIRAKSEKKGVTLVKRAWYGLFFFQTYVWCVFFTACLSYFPSLGHIAVPFIQWCSYSLKENRLKFEKKKKWFFSEIWP